MNLKKIICWQPLLGGIGAGVTIGILAYITFQSILSESVYGLWLATSFGSRLYSSKISGTDFLSENTDDSPCRRMS